MRNGWAKLLAICLIAQSFHAYAEEPALRLPAERVTLEPDDTLEFSLRANVSPLHPPAVSAWLLASGAAAPGADAQPSTRAYVAPSPRPGEWLVHVRGLQAERGTWDLFVRWAPAENDPDRAAGSRGEARLNGVVSIKAEAADVVLLMDGSLSMGRTDPRRLRVEAAREFITQARGGSVGRIAIVQFDSKSRTLVPLIGVNEDFEPVLEQIDERGETDIDGGIRHSLPLLAQSGAIVLLTDGKQEPGEYRNAHAEAKKAGIAIHTLALGRDADRELLRRIAAETGGTFSDAAKDRDLALAYSAIASRIARVRPIRSAERSPLAIPVDGACRSLAVRIEGEQNGTLTLSAPQGETWKSSAQAAPSYFKDKPATGGWSAEWNGPAARIAASARTALYPQFFRADLSGAGAVVLDTDEPHLSLSLAEGAVPRAAERVRATFVFDDGRLLELELNDAGRDGDSIAGDGVFALDLPPFAGGNGAYPEAARGTLRLSAEGQREGLAYARETETAFVFRRHLGAALIAGGALDFGTRFNGEGAQLEVPLRVRGPGGALRARLLPPDDPALRDGRALVELDAVPAEIGPRQRATPALKLALGAWQEAGLYGGVVEFELAGTGRARVPWRVRLATPALRLPRVLDVGLLAPGQGLQLRFDATVDGGATTVESIEMELPWRARRLELFAHPAPAGPPVLPGIDLAIRPVLQLPARVTPAVTEFVLDARVADDAPGGALRGRLLLRDAARRVLGSVVLEGRIASQYLQTQLNTLFGPVEAGDRKGRSLRWTLIGHGAENVRLPERTRMELLPDTRLPLLPAELLPAVAGDDCGARSRLVLKPSPEARAGESGGWLQIECGPVLVQRRWSAFIVQPHLGIEPSALDFGTLAPGQRKTLRTGLTTHAVKPVPLEARVARALAKPNLPNIRIEEQHITIALPPEQRVTGVAEPMKVTLEVPDNVQDGVYVGSLEISSRLGHIALPVRVNVVSPVAVAPFHVSPANVLLRFEHADAAPPTERLRITSHRDVDQTLVLQLQPDGAALCASLMLDPNSDLTADTLTLALPARATLDVSVRALPGARAGERSRVQVSGEADQHSVSLLIERPHSNAQSIVSDEPSRLLNWLLLLLVLLLMLLAYLIRNLIRRRWLRYAVYSLLFHAAFFPLVMPRQKILDALPSSMQLTLLETEASLGMELSEQQMRRLDALQAGEEPPPPVRRETELSHAPLPAPALPEKKAADAPSKAELEKRIAEEMRAALEALPEPVRNVVHTVHERPLEAEMLRPPEPAPKQAQPAEAAVAARSATTLAERFSDAPLPAAPERPQLQPERSAAELPLAALPEVAPLPAAAAPAAALRPAEQRTPAIEDAPLKVEQLPVDASLNPPVQSAERTDRMRDLAAQVQSALASSAAPQQALPLPNASAARGNAENAARAAQVPAASVRGEREGAPAQATAAGGLARAALSRPAGAVGNGASLDGMDVPLDAGPRVGAFKQSGSDTASATDRGGGEGPQAARGQSLTALQGDGPVSAFAAGLERSAAFAASGGRAVPRTGSAGLDRAASPGETAGRANAPVAGAPSARPGRESGPALDGAPLEAGDLGKVVVRKDGSEAGQKPAADAGRGQAATLTGAPTRGTGLARLPAGFGTPQTGATARPGERTTPALKALPGLSSLDPRPAGGPGGGKLATSQKGERLMNAPYTGALLKVNIGLAQHDGDWNSSPTALYNLRAAFLERCGLPEVEFKINTVQLGDVKALLQNRTVLVTSNNPIPFKPEELRAMREYMLAGGTLWVNDSSASESNTFDTAFRAAIANLLPGTALEPLALEHPFFAACYDLRGGFKGYRVPPGDKYRVNYIEALLQADGRAPLIYTRNDYADGLEIDPRMSAGGKSLTDLTNAEMQEASLRFCLNLVAYSMQGSAPKMPPPPEGVAEFEKLYRYNGPPLPQFDDFTELLDAWQKPVWLAEKEWCNPTELQIADEAETKSKALRVEFKGGPKFKAAITRNKPAELSGTKALVADLHSSLGSGFNVALLFYMKDGRSFETRPVFVRPGWNRNVRFPVDMGDMKSSVSNPPWKDYDQPFAPRNNVERITLLFYNLGESGSVKVGPLREQK